MPEEAIVPAAEEIAADAAEVVAEAAPEAEMPAEAAPAEEAAA